MENRFKDSLLRSDEFTLTLELIPGRGSRGKVQQEILSLVEEAVKGGHIHAVSLTDNPGGHPALAPDLLGVEISQMGRTPIVHFTGKDRNRNQVESLLYGLDRAGIRNILVMTGDYPQYGFEGEAKPVFDLDSVHILHMVGRMNEGLEVDGRAPGGGPV